MPVGGERLQTALAGCAKVLRENDLSLPNHHPYPMRWGRKYPLIAQVHPHARCRQTFPCPVTPV